MGITYRAVEKPFIQIEDHIVLPKELVDQLQKVLEASIARDQDKNRKIMEVLGQDSNIISPPKVIKLTLDTDQGWGITFIIDIAPRSIDEVQKDEI